MPVSDRTDRQLSTLPGTVRVFVRIGMMRLVKLQMLNQRLWIMQELQ